MLFHTLVILAKRFATLDLYSEGRAVCGLGIGWSKDEYQVSNIPFKDRGKRADEFLQAMIKIWTEDVVEFEGQFYNIPPYNRTKAYSKTTHSNLSWGLCAENFCSDCNTC
jgi:alkanesulfonate monooxygenase SsuD/methylene tetrahydromethanopterin reductase-like flavin-dependent oxidoreductase (luciferase family)